MPDEHDIGLRHATFGDEIPRRPVGISWWIAMPPSRTGPGFPAGPNAGAYRRTGLPHSHLGAALCP
ncbi:hypothetical protein [Micromonospora sp. Llam0]|uniref:hypothetical protein n=1 Tax=Micromonospora sp. Llam0 TaxID=2485143 RepID=UPI000F4AD038|nr:hypothetical protein [Micromonospora sp. Llam0]